MTAVNRNLRAASEAVFGSAARGDSDEVSDRDYLIVDDDTEVLRRRASHLRRSGWSVASYTYSKLNALADAGALFLQHLKDEAEILHDVGARLRWKLSNFTPKDSYHAELKANALIAHLIETRPSSVRGSLWAADVLYVTLRNYGVLRLAERKEYTFSYREVLEGLASIGEIRGTALPALLKLRFLKSLYRSGESFKSHHVDEALSFALSQLPADRFPLESAVVPAADVIGSLRSLPAEASAYHRLRNLEKGYIAATSLTENFDKDEELKRLNRWIENPRAYVCLASRMEQSSIRSLRNLINRLPEVQSAAGR